MPYTHVHSTHILSVPQSLCLLIAKEINNIRSVRSWRTKQSETKDNSLHSSYEEPLKKHLKSIETGFSLFGNTDKVIHVQDHHDFFYSSCPQTPYRCWSCATKQTNNKKPFPEGNIIICLLGYLLILSGRHLRSNPKCRQKINITKLYNPLREQNASSRRVMGFQAKASLSRNPASPWNQPSVHLASTAAN